MPCVLHHAGVLTCRVYSSCRSARMPYVLHHAGVHACHMYFIMRCLSTSHNVIHCHPACL